MHQFSSWKEVFKLDKGQNYKEHNNVDGSTCCKTFIQFHIDEDSKWIATRHDVKHNHPLCSPSKQAFKSRSI